MTSRSAWRGRVILALLVLVVLTPLGLLTSASAWGEWGLGELAERLGWVPEGLRRLSGLWSAPLADYGVPGVSDTVGYVLSALVGALVVGVAGWAVGRFAGRER